MNSRLLITIFLCAWMAVFPVRIGAGEDGLKPGPGRNTTPGFNFPPMGSVDATDQPGNLSSAQLQQFRQLNHQTPLLPGKERTASEWAEHRKQTARQRANAIAHVKRSRWIPNITYTQIQEIYDAKKAALAKVVADGNHRRTLIRQAKIRALAEVKAMVAALRDRKRTEQLALFEAAAMMRSTNPNYDEDALRKAMAEAQQQGGARVEALEGLPVLPNATAMNYSENGRPDMLAKRNPEPAIDPKEQAQLEALRDYKKKLALESVKQARLSAEIKRQKISHRETEQKLGALLSQFTEGKITSDEYYKRREVILREGGVK